MYSGRLTGAGDIANANLQGDTTRHIVQINSLDTNLIAYRVDFSNKTHFRISGLGAHTVTLR